MRLLALLDGRVGEEIGTIACPMTYDKGRSMRSSMIVVALALLVALPAQAQNSGTTTTQVAQGKKKGGNTFYYGRCRERGGTAYRCGVRMHYWFNRHPNGTVVY